MHFLYWTFVQGFSVVHTSVSSGSKAFSGSVVFLFFERIFFFFFNVDLKGELRKKMCTSPKAFNKTEERAR